MISPEFMVCCFCCKAVVPGDEVFIHSYGVVMEDGLSVDQRGQQVLWHKDCEKQFDQPIAALIIAKQQLMQKVENKP